jgi:hypothetical protein
LKFVIILIFITEVSFLKIGEIDTLKENFSADVYIQARWREPLLDKVTTVNETP